MGSPDDELGRSPVETQHDVTLTRAFWMGDTEVTQGAWVEVMGTNPSRFEGTNRPVEQVSWWSAVSYANTLSAVAGLTPCYTLMTGCSGTAAAGTLSCSGVTFTGLSCTGYRLPTESEWEYASRAGTTTATYIGNLTARECSDTTLLPIAWFCGNNVSPLEHKVVAQKVPNSWALYDTLGNVFEWTWDWDGTYPGSVMDPIGPDTGSDRVYRGGSWNKFALFVRAALRYNGSPDDRYDDLGFRLARSVP